MCVKYSEGDFTLFTYFSIKFIPSIEIPRG